MLPLIIQMLPHLANDYMKSILSIAGRAVRSGIQRALIGHRW